MASRREPIATRIPPRSEPVAAIDTWRTLPGEHERYLRFLELNWIPAREEVAATGHVLDWRIVVLDSAAADQAGWDVMLMTTYRDSASWARREELFAPVLAGRGLVRVDGRGPRDMARFVWETAGTTRGPQRPS